MDCCGRLMKSALEQMLGSEMNFHLGRSQLANPPRGNVPEFATAAGQPKNRRNGHSPKTIQGDMGKLPLDIPRDREGTFEPQLIGKHQRRLAGFDEKIRALYAKGMTTRESALKLIYMAIAEASKKWTMPIPHWKAALNHFAIMFEDRINR